MAVENERASYSSMTGQSSEVVVFVSFATGYSYWRCCSLLQPAASVLASVTLLDYCEIGYSRVYSKDISKRFAHLSSSKTQVLPASLAQSFGGKSLYNVSVHFVRVLYRCMIYDM